MEIHDEEQEHLQSVLHDEGNCNDAISQERFLSPTEQELTLRDRKRSSSSSAAAAAAAAKTSSRPLRPVQDLDTTVERYSMLPSYAQNTFVQKTNQQSTEIELESVPSDSRIHEILVRTAKRAVESPQLEVMLKLRQSHNNPDFAFLQPQHRWHGYYLHCKRKARKKEPEILVVTTPAVTKKQQQQQQEGLFDAYSSSSSSDDDNDADEGTKDSNSSAKNGHETIAESKKHRGPTSTTEERKAKRLKKAKALRGHFALKLLERKDDVFNASTRLNDT